MPLLTTAREARALYDEARTLGYIIPGFCIENTDTLECILHAAKRAARRVGVPDIPICIGFTGHLPDRTQLANYTTLGTPEEGLLAIEADLKRLLRAGGPFADLRVHAHYDHGQPGLDDSLIEAGKGWIASVMFDASMFPLSENRRRTREFVEAHRDVFLVEGAVDEIPEQGRPSERTDELTSPEEARSFLEETGVDLIVVNVGTEHRATRDKVRYHRDRAREIGQIARGRMVIHGTSSLGGTPISVLPEDGFARFNLWTAIEKTGGQALARDAIRRAGDLLASDELVALEAEGWLGHRPLETAKGPSLDALTHLHRRNDVWAPTVIEFLEGILSQCCFERLRPCS